MCSKRGKEYSDCVELLNRRQQLFGWGNEKLGESLPEEEEPVYPDILAKNPGVLLKSDLENKSDAMTIPPPSLSDKAEAAIYNTNLGKLTGVQE